MNDTKITPLEDSPDQTIELHASFVSKVNPVQSVQQQLHLTFTSGIALDSIYTLHHFGVTQQSDGESAGLMISLTD